MSDGMGRELAYLSSHATNRYFIPNWGLNSTNAAFYFTGVCLRLSEKRLDEIIKPSLWSILPFIAIASFPNYKNWNFLAVTILALSFLSFVPKLIQSINNKKVLGIIGYIGRNTLPIYLFHPIFTMGGKLALPLFHFDNFGGGTYGLHYCR